MEKKIVSTRALLAAGALWMASDAVAQDSQDLALQLSNPVASLVSVPFQFNFDQNIGPADDGERFFVNIQPVIPISISKDWNLISRTILPITYQNDIFPGAGDQFGLGDTVQSAFFSPKEIGPSGWIWGVGPVLLLPTATDELLGADKWGAGPTAVFLKQQGGLTYRALVNHIRSFAGDNDRRRVNSSFLQPFLAYATADGVTYSINTESTYDWEDHDWSVPINLNVSKLFTVGGQAMQLGAGVRFWATTPDSGPEGVGLRINYVLLFPTG